MPRNVRRNTDGSLDVASFGSSTQLEKAYEIEARIEKQVARLLYLWAEQNRDQAEQMEDSFGAKLVHTLCISHTTAACNLALALFEDNPRLLLGTYSQHSQKEGPFVGQGSLHVVVVNQNFEMLKRCIAIALEASRRSAASFPLADLLAQTARGSFFRPMPMRHFGGTLLGFAATFGMLEAFQPALEDDLTLRARLMMMACPVSGMLPIHAATTSGQKAMFTLLVDRWGADEFALTLAGMTPLKLAAKFGFRTMFRFVLRRTAVINYSWGPVTSYMLPLDGVDTVGNHGVAASVMELVTAEDASEQTQKLLLDSFMNGFIFELFQSKWSKWIRFYWGYQVALELASCGVTQRCTSLHRDLPLFTAACRCLPLPAAACRRLPPPAAAFRGLL